MLNFGTLSGGTNVLLDDIAGLNVDQITFTAGGYSLTGGTVGGIVLGVTGSTTPAILDSAGGNSILATNTFSVNLAGAATVEVDAGVDMIAAPISGTGFGITKAGVGTLVVSGANTYTGMTTISAGILKLGSAGVAPATPLGETGTTETGGGLDLNGQSLAVALPITLSGTGLTSTGAMLNSGAIATYSGPITLGGASSIVAGTATTGSIVLSNTSAITGSGFNLDDQRCGQAPRRW